MLYPRLIDSEEESHDNVNSGPISATSMVDTQLPNEIYCNMCSQLNKKQRLV